jgi:ribosomal protein S27AE
MSKDMAVSACAECGQSFVPVHRRQFCEAHSRRGGHGGRYPRRCHSCARTFTTKNPTTRYCSLACRPRDIASREARAMREAKRAVREAQWRANHEAREHRLDRICPQCGTSFVAAHGQQKFCAVPCYQAHHRTAHGPRPLECVLCHEPFESRQPNARYCSNQCRGKADKKRPSEYARRRNKEKVRRLRPLVLARYGMTCYLCAGPILYGTDSVHPLALTMDHLMPVSMGGRDTVDNLRPAHRACNEDKGERAPYWWELRTG